MTIFVVQSTWQIHCESSPSLFGGCWTFGVSQLICRLVRHFLPVLSWKADIHFTITWRVEGWVNVVAGCTLRWFTCRQAANYSSINRTRHWVTSLIETNVLPLNQTIKQSAVSKYIKVLQQITSLCQCFVERCNNVMAYPWNIYK